MVFGVTYIRGLTVYGPEHSHHFSVSVAPADGLVFAGDLAHAVTSPSTCQILTAKVGHDFAKVVLAIRDFDYLTHGRLIYCSHSQNNQMIGDGTPRVICCPHRVTNSSPPGQNGSEITDDNFSVILSVKIGYFQYY